MSKYKAKRAQHNGIEFASKAERDRYIDLLDMVDSGEITDLVRQPKYLFSVYDRPVLGYKQGRQIGYVGDYEYRIGDRVICEDVKGFPTPEFKLKFSFVRALYPRIEFYLYQKRRGLYKPEDKK